MHPLADLAIAEQRQADFERRAVEFRYARALRRRRTLPVRSVRRRPAPAIAPVRCCPA